MYTSYMALGEFPICLESPCAHVQNGMIAAIQRAVERLKPNGIWSDHPSIDKTLNVVPGTGSL